jgi:hypothetical protein
MPAPAPRASRPRRWRSPLLAVLLAGAAIVSARADAQSSILHEFIPPDPGEDVTFAATTIEGDLPSAIQTPSGLATAPDPRRSPGDNHVYGGATTDDSPDSTYEPDRDTRRPKIENYDDPFSPATAPFKRLRAYDWVDADYSLRVRNKSLQQIPVGGSVAAGDEPFFGDLSVDLLPGQPVRIPTVGPGARILRMHVNPELPVDVLRDGADNWFVRGASRARVRVVVELAIPRDTFGRAFADVEWSVLDAVEASAAKQSGLTGAHLHDAAFNEVAQAIGVSRVGQRPRDVVRKMVDYFRAFAPSEEPPSGRQDIYLDLALSRKGVCRHRAFAFLVTSLGLGIPTRMVVNEAHAWVEVSDGKLWHRVDLGGAAANLDNEPDASRPAYVPPPDPYAWPSNRDSGQDLADRNRSQGNGRGSASPGDADAGSPSGALNGLTPGPASSADPAANRLPEAEVTVNAIDGDVRRGVPLHLQGQVHSGGAPCGHLRVDVILVSHVERAAAGGSSVPPQGATIGSLSTDEHGKYDGAVVIPRDFSLGDYDLLVQTPGDLRCGAGKTR